MFNKEKFKKYLNDLNLDTEDYIIVAGGSLLLQSIKDVTEDIDLYVNEKAFNKLKELFEVRPSNKPYENHYIVNDNLEVVLKDDINRISYNLVDGYRCSTLEYEYEWKKKNNRPKDKDVIKKLEKYMELFD